MLTLRVLRLLFHPPWKGGPGWKKVTLGSACQGLNLPSSFMQEGFPHVEVLPARGSALPSSLRLPYSAISLHSPAVVPCQMSCHVPTQPLPTELFPWKKARPGEVLLVQTQIWVSRPEGPYEEGQWLQPFISSMFNKADSSFTSSCSQQNQRCRRGASCSLTLWDPLHLTGKFVFLCTDPRENIVKKRQLKIQALDLSKAFFTKR